MSDLERKNMKNFIIAHISDDHFTKNKRYCIDAFVANQPAVFVSDNNGNTITISMTDEDFTIILNANKDVEIITA